MEGRRSKTRLRHKPKEVRRYRLRLRPVEPIDHLRRAVRMKRQDAGGVDAADLGRRGVQGIHLPRLVRPKLTKLRHVRGADRKSTAKSVPMSSMSQSAGLAAIRNVHRQ